MPGPPPAKSKTARPYIGKTQATSLCEACRLRFRWGARQDVKMEHVGSIESPQEGMRAWNGCCGVLIGADKSWDFQDAEYA